MACGIVACVIARIVPSLRRTQWLSELLLSLMTAAAAGLGATALDFGGWNEADWRAGVFAFACSFALIAWVRVMRR
jgi:hypothetical protein